MDHLKKFVLHYAAVISGAALAVTYYAPQLMSAFPQWAKYITGAVGIASAILSIAKIIGIIPTPPVPVPQQSKPADASRPTGGPVRAIFPLVMALSAALLVGCVTLSATEQEIIQTGIDLGVGAVLANNPADAQAIETAATTLAGLAANSSTTVATLISDADAVIAKMPALNGIEKLAIENAIQLAATYLQAQAAKIPSQASVNLQLIFTDIATAAGAFTTQTPMRQKLYIPPRR